MSLRSVLVVPFVLQVFAAVGLTGWLSLQNGQKAVNDVASQLRSEVTERIRERLLNYIATPPLVNQITANAIATGQLDLENEQIRGRHFWKQVLTFIPISFHYFGNTKGEFFTARRLPRGEVQVGLVDQSTHGSINYFIPNDLGDRTTLVDIVPSFDPRTRPWYKTAVTLGKPAWTKIYRHFVTKGLSITAVQPVYDDFGKLKGVLGTDFLFLQINEFLQSLKIGKSGQTFIVERDGMLVSTSTRDPIFMITGDKTERIKASSDSNQSSLIKLTAKHLEAHFGSLTKIYGIEQFAFEIDGKQQFAQVMPLQDGQGIDWLIVVVVPESDFMKQINANTQTTILLCGLALIVSVGIGMLTAQSLVQPILRMIYAADALSRGEWQQYVSQSRVNELGLLAKAFNRMAVQLQDFFTQLQYSASHDALTDLPNRTAFMHSLQAAIAHASQQSTSIFAVLFLDLDSFKLINDSLGHLVGDQLLVSVTQRIQSCMGKNDMLARFGGDEFTILLRDIVRLENATRTAEKISQALKLPFILKEHEVFVSASIGIVISTTESDRPEDYIRDADIAMYHAKSSGKDRYEIFDRFMYNRTVERLQMETDLRRGLERGEFQVYYQPVVAATTTAITGFEALVRWNHPTLGLIRPSRFIPVAEETGLIVRLGQWVLQEACRQMHEWHLKFPFTTSMFISVNLSGRQLLHLDLVEQIQQVLKETGLSRNSLKLEITESTIMSNVAKTGNILQTLQSSGIQLGIDDFGTGYSSLSYLHRFPLNTLKIDRSFISRLGANGENQEIIAAIIMLAHNLNMDVIAEGVEIMKQMEILRSLGCEQMQGYLFSSPLPASAIEKMLANQISFTNFSA